jgi:hypothetical protein
MLLLSLAISEPFSEAILWRSDSSVVLASFAAESFRGVDVFLEVFLLLV